MVSGPSVYQHPTLVRGIDNLLCDMMIFPELAELLMDKYTNFYLQYFEKMFIETKGRIDILRIADDIWNAGSYAYKPGFIQKICKTKGEKVDGYGTYV